MASAGLPPLRAWVPIPSPTATVGDLEQVVSKMLGGIKVELELQGGSLSPTTTV